jgi:hypothetical protein
MHYLSSDPGRTAPSIWPDLIYGRHIFNLKVGITLQLSPIFVAGDQCHLFDWTSGLEQTARSLVTQIVEV